ncbi:phage terminase small subunit [Pseudomonas laurylsulfativorans]|uniref:terminase small subunit n=1 Tax=Pseudomonas laurylsulfativorans TaxID=1943631 RepID=UPI0020A22A74|nr:terminase small subunit [Pseudomonas laurylsulfativorans]MCP1419909.1 phage terminase small subunit [Pseudomonas laurylsulfativorans]
MALTTKQRAFVDAVRGGASNKDAAIAAGYAASSASVAGSRLAKHPNVLAALAYSPINKNVKAGPKPVSEKPQAEDLARGDAESSFDFSKAMTFTDPKAFLIATMNDYDADAKLRVDAAKALMPFIHPRKGEGGKKEEKEDAAKKAAKGKFGAATPPPTHLRSVK